MFRMLFLFLFLTLPLRAAEPPTITVRVFGLFGPEREAVLREHIKQWPDAKIQSLDFDRAVMVLTLDEKSFAKGKPADILNRLGDRLSQDSNHTLALKAPFDTSVDKLKRIEIDVAGLDCQACCLAAYEIVAKLEGVEQATASFKAGKITALVNPAKVDKTAIEAALRERGVALKPSK